MKPWEGQASKQVRLEVSKGMRRPTAARLEPEPHESAVWDLATELQRQHSSSTSSALLMLEEQDLGFMFLSAESDLLASETGEVGSGLRWAAAEACRLMKCPGLRFTDQNGRSRYIPIRLIPNVSLLRRKCIPHNAWQLRMYHSVS